MTEPIVELLDRLERRYMSAEIPPCSVCGRELSIQAAGGGKPTVYGCADRPRVGEGAEDQDAWSDHFRRSFVQRRVGDDDVLAAVAAIRAIMALVDQCWSESEGLHPALRPHSYRSRFHAALARSVSGRAAPGG